MLKTIGESLYNRKETFSKLFSIDFVLNLALIILTILLISALVFNNIFISIHVDGRSMLPTLTGAEGGVGGDYIYVNTMISPDYGDIVVVKVKDDSGANYNIIKRVIAFGGDAVKLEKGKLFIRYSGTENYTEVSEDYLNREFCDPDYYKNSFDEHVVSSGCMFLMGDNRNESSDSREKGDFPVENLIGVAQEWSIRGKKTITAIFTFFKSTLPGVLGMKLV